MSIESARAEVIGVFKGLIEEIDRRLESRRNVIALHNSVVRTSPGLFLVPKGDGYGVDGITRRVVLWSPDDARKMAEHARKTAGCEAAEAVPYVTALREERAELERLIGTIKKEGGDERAAA